MARDQQSHHEARVAAIAALTGTRVAEDQFLHELLSEVATSAAVRGGGVWQLQTGGAPVCLVAVGDLYQHWLRDGGASRSASELRAESLHGGEKRLIPREGWPTNEG